MRKIFVVFILAAALGLGLIPAGGGIFAAETQDTASDTGFVINKVDDNEVPVEGAVFDIYGKPEVSWEEITEPDPEPCKLDPPVEKIITGDTESAGGGDLPEFSFTLKAVDPSYPMPGGHEGDEMHATVNGTGPVEFGFITFTEAGTYEYTVSEDPHGEENYSVDENVYTITYVIEEVDGKLQGVRIFFKKGEVQEAIEKIVFENVYTAPEPEETTSVTVTKVWDDDENRDGKRPDKVTVGLRADGGNTGRSAELSAANDWTYTWGGLPKQENGADISYTVTENETEGYVADITGDAESGFTITNSYTSETTNVSGIKTWDDADNQDGKRPANVTVRLHADGIEKDTKTVSPDASGNWSYSFENLPKYKDGGIEIKYTVTEDSVKDYQAEYISTLTGYNIVNKYTPGKTDVSVSKHWEDKDDQDGKRTDAIVSLLADGVDTGKTLTLTEEKRTDVFSDLDEYKDGKKIVYTVAELDGDKELKDGDTDSNGYTVNYAGDAKTGFTITNTYTPETVSVSGTKTWNDNDNQDGKRPDKVTVRLHADGEIIDTQTVTEAETGNWTYSFADLAKYKNGKEIVYTVTEDSTEDYQAHYKTTANGTDITNEYTPGKTEVSVSKHWEDSDDQDGIRPKEVKVRLLADGAPVDEPVALNAANSWDAEFTDLDEYKSGRKIAYTVEEVRTDVITGTNGAGTYATTTSGDATTGYVITNTHTPVKMQVKVSKKWEDADDQDGKRPASVTVKLLADGVETGSTVVLNEDNGWEDSFKDLDAKKAGRDIAYTVKELSTPEGYTSEESGDAENGFIITNSYSPETTSISGTKEWEDANNQDGKRPESVTVDLLADNVKVDSYTATAEDGWGYTFYNLPMYKEGRKIEYTVVEQAVAEYTSSVSGYDITNSYTPGKTQLNVVKVWEDAEDQDGIRPERVTVKLLADGKDTGKTTELNADNKWESSFTGLDKMSGGKEIAYSVEEAEVPSGYTTAFQPDGSTVTITNTHAPETVSVSGTKTWNDNDNQDGKRPDKVTVRLHADGEIIDTQTVTEAETGNWTYSFADLAKYKNGKEIVYTVTEDSTEDYQAHYNTTANGTDITNEYTPGKTEVSVSKHWEDNEDQDGIRPEEVQVRLLADGATTDKTVTLNKENNWTAAFEALDEYKSGRRIEYTVEEVRADVITGTNGAGTYATTTSGDATTGYVITNTHTPVKMQVKVSKKWEDADDQDGKRPASVTVKLLADGEGTGKSLVLNEENEWKASFTDLDANKAGKVIDYTVAELDADAELKEGETGSSGYTVSYTGDAVSGYTITNTYTPETVRVAGSKTWDDANNQDGKRPDKVTVRLHADGIEKDTKNVRPDASGNWSYSFENLPKYKDGGIEIKYTVTEDSVKDYQAEYISTLTGYNIVNKYTPGKTDVSVSKHWEDKDDQDGKRTDAIVRLLADGVDTGKTLTLTEEKRTDVFSDLDEYKDGKKIQYTVAELDGDKELKDGERISNGYTVSCSGDAETGYTITNTYTPETVAISGTKTWNDNDNQDGKRPDKVTVRLHADGEVIDTQTVTEDETGNWTYSFTDLPKCENGKEIVYTVTEDVEENYTSNIDGYNIVNNYTPGKTEVEVSKAWHDNNDQDGIRPDSVTVKLLADGATTDKTVTLNKENNWTAAFEALDEYKSGRKIAYTVEEVRTDVITGTDGAGAYATSTSGDATTGYVITNTHTPVKTQVNVTKQWEDADDQDGKRPASVTVKLLADGEGTGKSLVLNEKNEWKASFTDLDVNKAGKVIVYTVAELDADVELKEGETGSSGYTVSYTGDAVSGYTITNTYTPETVRVAGSKTWDDANNQDGKRPESITINLLEDGTKVDSKVVTEADEWKWTFDKLAKYKEGKEIKYTITEEPVAEYTPTIDGYNVTNKHTPETISFSGTKHWYDNNNQDGKRPASVTVRLHADGVEKFKIIVKPDENGAWSYSFGGLPKYEAGRQIEYSVIEDEPEGYRASYSTNGDSHDITNTHTPETTQLTLTKTWNDAAFTTGDAVNLGTANEYARPDLTFTITGTVKGTQEKVSETTERLTEANQKSGQGDVWEKTITNLPKYNAGREIEYTASENVPAGFTKSGEGTAFTNTPSKETDKRPLTLTVLKTDASDGKALAGAVFTVTKEGASEGNALAATGTDGRTTHTFTEAGTYIIEETVTPAGYKQGSSRYTLVVDEELKSISLKENVWLWLFNLVSGSGSDAKITGSADTGYTLSVENEPETVDIEVEKKWYDDDMFDTEGNPIGNYKRPDTITVNLTDENEEIIETAELTEQGDWKVQWTVPKYYNGELIDYQEYTVSEVNESGFGGEQGHPEPVYKDATDTDSQGGEGSSDGSGGADAASVSSYKTVILNAPIVREDLTSVSLNLYKIDASTWGAADKFSENLAQTTKLAGAKFTLMDEYLKQVTLTTDSNGAVKHDFTMEGVYTLEETTAPTGYDKADGKLHITVEKGELKSLIFDEEAGEWVKSYDLSLNVETPKEGAAMNPAPHIDANTNSIAVGNAPQTTEITVTKIWNDKEFMEGEAAALGDANEYKRPKELHFSIVGKAGGQSVYTGKFTMAAVDEKQDDSYTWQKTITGLPKYSGGDEISYSVEEQRTSVGNNSVGHFDEETTGPWGYWRAMKSGGGLTFTNTPRVQTMFVFNFLTIKKIDENTDQPLAGAVFTVTYDDGSTLDTSATDDNGVATISVRTGKNKIKEKKAPAGYEADDTEYTLVIEEKLDGIRYNDGWNLADFTRGSYVKSYMYSIAEGSSPKFTKSGNNTFELTVGNTPEKVDISVTKEWNDSEMFDNAGKPIGDYKRPDKVIAVLTDKLPDKPGDTINEIGKVELTADENGSWTGVIEVLPVAASGEEINYEDYFLIETPVPDGFVCEVSHPVKGADGSYTAKISNAPKTREEYTPVDVKLIKYSEAKIAPEDSETEAPRDVPLPGVKFSVTESGGSDGAGTGTGGGEETGTAQTLTTNANGKATFTAAKPGAKFVVKETETLNGYYNNGATFTLGVEKGKLESLAFDADTGEWVKTYSLYTEALAEGKNPADLAMVVAPLTDVNGNYLKENEDTYILRNKPLATLEVEKYFYGINSMSSYEDGPKDFAITLSYTDAAGNAQQKRLTAGGEYWNQSSNAWVYRWIVPDIPYNAEVTLEESGFERQGYAIDKRETFVLRTDPNAPGYRSDMTDEAQVSDDKTSVTFNMPAHYEPDAAWRYSEADGGGSLGLYSARVRFDNHYYSTETIDVTGTKRWIDGGKTHDNAKEVKLTLSRRIPGTQESMKVVSGITPVWNGDQYTFANMPKDDSKRRRYEYWVTEEPVAGYDAPKYTNRVGDNSSLPGAPNGGIIRNELSQEFVEITVTKQWEDADNQDGKRPDALELALYRTGKEVGRTYTEKVAVGEVKVEKSGNTWTYTFTRDNGTGSSPGHLKYDHDRSEFIYEVREETVPTGYTVSYADADGTALDASATGVPNGGTITNTHTPDTLTISGTKTWNDDNNRDGKRPDCITVNLLDDGTKVDSTTVEPDASGAWEFSFADKPVYKNGSAIVYTVQEEAVAGYTPEITGSAEAGFTITNTHTTEQIAISGIKEWKHAEGGAADPTVDRFTVTLQKSADGTTWTDVASRQVAARTTDTTVTPNAWTFENQYKYENGTELQYRCLESPTIAGWVATEGTADNGYKIVNTTSQEQISFTVNKTWDDNNNAAGKRPGSVRIGLYRYDSTAFGPITFVKEFELSAASNWQSTVTANKYFDGVEAKYTVWELDSMTDGYYASLVSGDAVNGFKIINKRPEITISGRKTWSAPTGTDTGLFPKPDSITVYLQKKVGNTWETVETKTVPTSGTGADTWTFSNVAQIDSQTRQDVEYRVAEEPVPGWKVSLEGTADNNYNIVNTLDDPGTVRLVKTWNDNNNAGGFRPGTEAFANGGYLKLLRNGVDTGLKPQVIYLSSSPNIYTVTWTIPASDTAAYTVAESPVAGYVAGEITGSGTQTEPYRLTNTISTTINGTKTWPASAAFIDPDLFPRPAGIPVTLQKKVGDNWVDVESKDVSGDATAQTWSFAFADVPKYDSAGNEIEYKVVEGDVAGYQANSEGTASNGYNIANAYDAIRVTLTKTWEGDGSYLQYRPDASQYPSYLELFRNNEKLVGADVPEPIVVDNNNNTYSVTYVLPRADENGTDYDYKIKEVDVPYYTEGAVAGTMEEGFTLTNTHNSSSTETIDVYGTKTWNFGATYDSQAIEYPVTLKVSLEQKTSDGSWVPVSGAETKTFEYDTGDTEFSPHAVATEEESGDYLQITDEYRWTVPKTDSGGNDIEYRVAENAAELAAKGFTQEATEPMSQRDGIEHNLVNKFESAATPPGGVTFTFNFTADPGDQWIAEEKSRNSVERRVTAMKNGSTVYKFSYFPEDSSSEEYYYGDSERASWCDEWYNDDDTLISVTDSDLISKLKRDAQVENEIVDRVETKGYFNTGVTKTVSITGTKTAGGSVSESFELPIKDESFSKTVALEPGEYTLTTVLPVDNDINQTMLGQYGAINSWQSSMIHMVNKVKLTVSDDGSGGLSCSVDTFESFYTSRSFDSSSGVPAFIAIQDGHQNPLDYNAYVEANGDQVTITNYIANLSVIGD